jgi:hypothetical protein
MLEHRAYAFDWESFDASLRPMLEYALSNRSRDILVDFINRNRGQLVDPYDFLPLPPSWHLLMENQNDIHTLGDFCLTRYYDRSTDRGLGERFESVAESMPENHTACLCGYVIGNEISPFDPGGMGSFFQRPRDVMESRSTLAKYQDQLADFLDLLDDCIADSLGLYVTL